LAGLIGIAAGGELRHLRHPVFKFDDLAILAVLPDDLRALVPPPDRNGGGIQKLDKAVAFSARSREGGFEGDDIAAEPVALRIQRLDRHFQRLQPLRVAIALAEQGKCFLAHHIDGHQQADNGQCQQPQENQLCGSKLFYHPRRHMNFTLSPTIMALAFTNMPPPGTHNEPKNRKKMAGGLAPPAISVIWSVSGPAA